MELVHAADIPVADLPGQFDLVPEAVDSRLVEGNLRMENLEGDLLADFLVVSAIDDAHAPGAQLFDQFKPPGEELPLAQPFGSCLELLGDG